MIIGERVQFEARQLPDSVSVCAGAIVIHPLRFADPTIAVVRKIDFWIGFGSSTFDLQQRYEHDEPIFRLLLKIAVLIPQTLKSIIGTFNGTLMK